MSALQFHDSTNRKSTHETKLGFLQTGAVLNPLYIQSERKNGSGCIGCNTSNVCCESIRVTGVNQSLLKVLNVVNTSPRASQLLQSSILGINLPSRWSPWWSFSLLHYNLKPPVTLQTNLKAASACGDTILNSAVSEERASFTGAARMRPTRDISPSGVRRMYVRTTCQADARRFLFCESAKYFFSPTYTGHSAKSRTCHKSLITDKVSEYQEIFKYALFTKACLLEVFKKKKLEI